MRIDSACVCMTDQRAALDPLSVDARHLTLYLCFAHDPMSREMNFAVDIKGSWGFEAER